MIYVTQGHEKGIGLEVFIKSFLVLSKIEQEKFVLICYPQSLINTLNNLKLAYKYVNNSHFEIISQKLSILEVDEKLQSTKALEKAIEVITPFDILVTLPTSKDQIFHNGIGQNGHTEWFRAHFNKEVEMFFKSYEANVLLISDHLPVKKLSTFITSELINKKIKSCVDNYNKYFGQIKEVFVAGLNPHAGEGGLIGREELDLKIENIKNVQVHSFIPADSMLANTGFNDERLFVFMYHDQGLTPFKTLFKTIGANISLGLPFLRLSVDHGTAFNLYGKNSADSMGSLYVLKLALHASNVLSKDQNEK